MLARRWLLLLYLSLNYTTPLTVATFAPQPWRDRIITATPLWSLVMLFLCSYLLRRNAREAMALSVHPLRCAAAQALDILQRPEPAPGAAARALQRGLHEHHDLLDAGMEMNNVVPFNKREF